MTLILHGLRASIRPGAIQLFTDLVMAADWRTHVVLGSDRELASRFDLARGTFADYKAVLVDAGLIEDRPDGYEIPSDVASWLRGEGPVPEFMDVRPVLALLGTGQVQAEAVTELVADHVARVAQDLDHAGSGSEPRVAQGLNRSGSNLGPVSAASPAETPSVEVEDSVDRQTGRADLVMAQLADLTGDDSVRSAAGIRREVDRLLSLDWTLDDIVGRFVKAWAKQQTSGRPDTPVGWTVTVLRDFDGVPARRQRDAQRQRDRERQNAAACEHGTPNGTYRQANGLSPCVQCNGTELRETGS